VKCVGFAVTRHIPSLGNTRFGFAKTIEAQKSFEKSVANTAFELAGDYGWINRFRFGAIKDYEVGALIVRTAAGD
jgi:hypothetical protein